MAATATSSSTSALSKSGSAASTRPAVPITRVAIRDGKTIAINDHIYISVPWAPGSGEPYAIARVMEFVTASPSRKGGQVLASTSGTLQVRANLYLRQRELNNKSISDPRLLVATMHSDVFALDNVRGLCVVRHRDLIGEATEVAAWKRREDHFYYYQLFDRYIHKYYDVIQTDKIRNVPFDVLTVLRNRYSFVVAEPSMTPDLCGALRGCAVCLKWASSTESVRCDTCKDFFHMHCLNPPLASKPAKGYSWTCAPCTRRHETVASGLPISRTAALDASAAIASSSSSASIAAAQSSSENPESSSYTVNRLSDANSRGGVSGGSRGRGRGRGRGKGASQGLTRSGLLASDEIGSSDQSRESSPSPYLTLPRRTIDDERGTRCFNRWPYRYFGECILATDILDPFDSIYPRAIPRLGIKFQTYPITWEEQEQLGMGVKAMKDFESSDGTMTPITEESLKSKKTVGRPAKKKKDDNTPIGTPTIPMITLPTEGNNLIRVVTDKEIERGTDESVEPLYLPGSVTDKTVDKYIKICKKQMPDLANHIGMLDRALKLLSQYTGNAPRALHELTNSTNEELMVDTWSFKESKQFHQIVTDYNADLRFLKKEIPTKTAAQIVRHFAYWKCKRIADQREEEKKIALESKPGLEKTVNNGNIKSELVTRAVSPSMSIMQDDEKDYPSQLPNKMCRMCATSTSSVWYKGAVVWSNRRLCVNCGLYWRKYGAEMPSSHPDMISTRKRDAAAMEEASLGVAPPVKAAKLARTESYKGSSPAQSTIALFEPTKCVLCKKLEPKKKLQQCRQCSLSIHQGCYGLNDQELADDSWFCEACSNERTLDATLIPQCVLCPVVKTQALIKEASVPPLAQAIIIPERIMGRARKSASIPPANVSPLGALDAMKPTECNNWTHFTCALFMPEVAFTEPERMRIVEGAGNLPFWRYEAHCDICNQRGGACIACADSTCKRTFHISCASQQTSFTLGIDLSPVKSTRRDTVVTTSFRGESGHMTAVIYCNNHKEVAKTRKLLDLSDVDSVSGLTATQVFASTHKTVKSSTGSQYDANTYPLLRRAKRFDAVLSGSLSILSRSNSKKPIQHTLRLSATSTVEDGGTAASIREEKSFLEDDKTLLSATIQQSSKHCCRCKTCFSPFWWLLPANAQELEQDTSNTWLQEAQEKQTDSVLCVRCRHLILPRLVM